MLSTPIGVALRRAYAPLVALFLVSGCSAPSSPSPSPDGDAVSQPSSGASTECSERLRSAVRERLLRGPSDAPAGQPMTALALERAWSSDENGHNYAGLALSTLAADDARELLTRMLSHANALSSLEAAAALAVLGSRAGLERLQRVETLTNSQIEFFYARAAFALLDEPAPASLTDRRSVFMELEAQIDACQQQARAPARDSS